MVHWSNKWDYRRLVFIALALAAGIGAGYFGQPFVHGKEKAIDVIITVFSILAGFLVAIMGLLGDGSLLLPGSWRVTEMQRKALKRRMARQQWLFYIYMLTLLAVFFSTLIDDDLAALKEWVERIYLGAAVTAFILSFGLPISLAGIQLDRVEAVIATRRSGSQRRATGERGGDNNSAEA